MTTPINNTFYDELGDRWWNDDSHPIAILRVEGELKCQYILDQMRSHFPNVESTTILDVACGAGFLTFPLADLGYQVKGVDFSVGTIQTASKRAKERQNPSFEVGDATKLSAPDNSYDCVLLMDCLEHFEQPALAVKEAARVVKPGGLIFIHTFNRTWFSRLLAVKSIEWLTRDAPPHIHVWEMFITPDELRIMARNAGLVEKHLTGIQPNFLSWGFWHTILARRLKAGFSFKYCKSTAVGYMGTFQLK